MNNTIELHEDPEDAAEMTPEEFREYMLNWMEEHTNE